MRHCFLTVCWLLFVVLTLPGPAAQGQLVQPDARSRLSVLLATPDLRRFAGTWIAHGSLLTVTPAGKGTFVARTYRWCASGVPRPCDTIDAQGRLVDGNREQLQFFRTDGARAYGVVLSSTFHPTGLSVTLTLQPDDIVLYAARTPIAFLCGRNAPAGACGA